MSEPHDHVMSFDFNLWIRLMNVFDRAKCCWTGPNTVHVWRFINSGKDESIIDCDASVKYVTVSDYQVCYLKEGKYANVNGKNHSSNAGIDGDGNGTDKTFAKYSVVVTYSCNGQARGRSVAFTFDDKATVEHVAWGCPLLMSVVARLIFLSVDICFFYLSNMHEASVHAPYTDEAQCLDDISSDIFSSSMNFDKYGQAHSSRTKRASYPWYI